MLFNLSASNYGDIRNTGYDMVILPWGATEPHNYHLPYLTDAILSQEVSLMAARKAWERHRIGCMVLPPVTLGSQNPGQRDLPFCIHARYETQRAVLGDIVASLHSQGVRRMLIVNGHGGNSFKNMIRDLAVDYHDFIIAASNWYAVVPPSGYFEHGGEHGDELETSVMLHFHPELVNMAAAGSGEAKRFASESLRDGVAWLPRNWQQVTRDTGIGDPSLASAGKGERFADAVTDRYADLIHDLVNMDNFYDK